MASDQAVLSTEFVNQGVKNSGPHAGSVSFSVKEQRRMPDFLSSVDLKYVKLGYCYLISHRSYFVIAPALVLIFSTEIGKLASGDLFLRCDIIDFCFLLGLLMLIVYVYLDLSPRSTYLVDFACYLPPKELKITKSEFINLAKKSGNFDAAAIEFQHRVLMESGVGDESYMPRSVFLPDRKNTLKEGREEVATVMFGAIDNLLLATGVRPKNIGILVVNCGFFSPTPSLSAMVVNHYKLRQDIHNFNLGGMGCAAGVIAIDLARNVLLAHPGTYALVVSTEVVSSTWYAGKDKDMLLPNCFFRMGAAAMLLSSRHLDRWRSKYELNQLVRTHRGTDDRSFHCICRKEDAEGKQGLSVNKDLLEVGRHALKAHITTLGPLVLPVSEQAHFFENKETNPYIPDYKLAFEHVCVLASSKRLLDEIQRTLELTEDYMEASRKTLERFGNTSSSSGWYALAYLEANRRIKRGDRVWQLSFGSGFKCNSVMWKALRNAGRPNKNPWIEDST